MQKAFITAAEVTGLERTKPKIHFHSLRHGHATESIRSNIKLASVSGALGHEDLSTTGIYVNLCPAERVAEYRAKFGRRQNE